MAAPDATHQENAIENKMIGQRKFRIIHEQILRPEDKALLTNIINVMFWLKYFPKKWKKADVIMLGPANQ